MPALLVIVSTAFLLIIVDLSKRRSKQYKHLGIWKNHTLALLFHGFDKETQRSVGPGCKIVDMEDVAKGTMVRLDEGGGLRSFLRGRGDGGVMGVSEGMEMANTSHRGLKGILGVRVETGSVGVRENG